MSAAAFSFHFFFFFVKLQQVYGYFLKEFSANVVSLAILRSCLRFENVPNADMMRLQMKRISSKYFLFFLVVGWGSIKEKVHVFLFAFFFSFSFFF